MLRTAMFTLLFSATFLPNMEITGCYIPINTTKTRKIMSALFMGTLFFIIKGLMPFNATRLVIQETVYFIGIYVFLGQGLKKSLQILLSMAVLSAVSEWLIISFLKGTQIGLEQLLMIDSFYVLTLFLNIALMTSIAFILKQFVGQKKSRQNQETMHL